MKGGEMNIAGITTREGLNDVAGDTGFNPCRVVLILSFLYPQLHWGLFILDPFRVIMGECSVKCGTPLINN